MDSLRRGILRALKHHERVTPSDLHRALGGRFTLMDIEAELIALDMDGLIINELIPVSRITQKGCRERGAKDAA